VGRIAEVMAEGLQELGSRIEYKANVKEILTEGSGDDQRAVGVRLADGRTYRCAPPAAGKCSSLPRGSPCRANFSWACSAVCCGQRSGSAACSE
jgi:hypothetical protein